MDEEENILDSQNKEIITINHGAMFPLMVTFLTIVVLLFGIALMLTLPWFIGVFCFLATFAAFIYGTFSTTGIDFSVNTRQVRLYSYVFFKKKGEWKDLDKYHDIAILSSNKAQTQHVGFMPVSRTAKFKTYDVYLLGVNHWKKIFVESFDKLDLANNQVKKLVEMFDLQFVTYNPKRISKRRVR